MYHDKEIKRTFQSTPSVGRATNRLLGTRDIRLISIHALRGEGDLQDRARSSRSLYFNPRPPWGGRLIAAFGSSPKSKISIHALRGEGDGLTGSESGTARSISIHALRGEGDYIVFCKEKITSRISIHALRGEGDALYTPFTRLFLIFQSTPSVGRATSSIL